MSGLSSSSTTSILPSTQAPFNVKSLAQSLRQYRQAGSDTAATALEQLQNQLDSITKALQAPVPVAPYTTLTDASGNVIGQIGYWTNNNANYFGAAFANLWVGPNANPATAPFFCNQGTVVIGQNGVVLVQDMGGNTAATLGVTEEGPLTVSAATNASPVVMTVPGNGYVNGDTIVVAGATSNTNINGYRIVENVGTAGAGTFTMTDLTGLVINGNGPLAGSAASTRYFAGILAETFAIGGSFPNYKLRAFADGSLQIQNATITVASGGSSITISPSGPTILCVDGSGDSNTINGTAMTLVSPGGPTGQYNSQGMTIINGLVVGKLLVSGSGSGALTLYDSTGLTSWIIADPGAATALTEVIPSADVGSSAGGIAVTTPAANALRMGVYDANYAWIQVYASLPLVLQKAGGAVGIGKSPNSSYSLDTTGDINSAGVFRKGGVQVVGAQKAAITAPSGGTTIDTQARTAINSILAVLSLASGGHGLTA